MHKLSFVLLFLLSTIIMMDLEAQPQIPNPKHVARPQYKMSVTQNGVALGEMTLEMCSDISPKHVENFDSLVKVGFYDGCAFHRVIPGFMIQGGDPNSKSKPRGTWGTGDPSQTQVPAEFNKIHHAKGIISAARTSDPNSATSQFFICAADAPHLDGQYTIYGEVIQGLDIIDKIVNAKRDQNDNPFEKIEMKIVKISPATKAKTPSHKH